LGGDNGLLRLRDGERGLPLLLRRRNPGLGQRPFGFCNPLLGVPGPSLRRHDLLGPFDTAPVRLGFLLGVAALPRGEVGDLLLGPVVGKLGFFPLPFRRGRVGEDLVECLLRVGKVEVGLSE
jgi:hypothetical protein